jgi:hypothetical protein
MVALLRTLPQLRMPNHLRARLLAIPDTNDVGGGNAPHARGSTEIRGSGAAGAQRKGAVSERLTYQETLRTVGTLLEHAGADAAVIALAPDRTEAILPTWRSPRVWDVDALQAEVARQRSWRQAGPRPADRPWAGPMSRDLRYIGWMLDAQLAGPYTVVVSPQHIQVLREGDDPHTFARASIPRAYSRA